MSEERVLSTEQRDQIRQAVMAGDKPRALEMVRKFTGFDTESSKVYLQEFEELVAMSADPDSGMTKEGALSTQEWATIDEFIYTGHKITAIKMARTSGGYDLAEAKELVEKRERELKQKTPEKFKQVKSGCMGKAAVFLLAVGGGVLGLLLNT
jgi:ribosomal protein L7/L12